MSGNAWIEYVKLYREKNPHLSYREAMQEAKVSYRKLKEQMGGSGSKCEGCKYDSPSQRNHMGPGGCMANNNSHHGGYDNIDLRDPQMRFEAGVSALNSNLADIGRKVIY